MACPYECISSVAPPRKTPHRLNWLARKNCGASTRAAFSVSGDILDNETNEEQTNEDAMNFASLGLSQSLVRALSDVGYETPTPIQERTIPVLLSGADVIGQAQTGTGKTAAFALPILENLDLSSTAVQALILAPTRELAIQVSEAIHVYARHLGRVRVMPIYGGDPIGKQITRLRGGINIVVGTPGRVMDHLRRGTLDFASLKFIVLDEADEMLRMGFIEDIEWILSQAPETRQIALFSATMPREVRRIADRYLKNPQTIEIQQKTMTVPAIEQSVIHVSERQKLDVLTHLLESEAEGTGADGGAILIFARTKIGAADLAEKIQARGYEAEAMHGDMSQAQRESVIRRMRAGGLEIVIATDVAARGLDVEHIGCVINYDIPGDPESYVHRIGRTGRAGRNGRAISFVTPRENRLLRAIEGYSGARMTPLKTPTQADITARRRENFKARVLATLAEEDLDIYRDILVELTAETEHELAEITAAALRLAAGDKPLVATTLSAVESAPPMTPMQYNDEGMIRFCLNIGRNSEVRPADIVWSVANEAGIPGGALGAIDIYDEICFVDAPSQFRDAILSGMDGAQVKNQEVSIRLANDRDVPPRRPHRPEAMRHSGGGKRGAAHHKHGASFSALGKKHAPKGKKRK